MDKKQYPLLIAALAILLVAVSGALVFKISSAPNSVPLLPSEGGGMMNADVNENSNPNPDNTPEPPATGAGHELISENAYAPSIPTVTVEWLAKGIATDNQAVSKELGRSVPSIKIITEDEAGIGGPPENPQFTKVGKISAATDATLVGRNLYHIDTSCGAFSMNCIDALAVIDSAKHQIVVFARYPAYNTASTLSSPLDKISVFDGKTVIPQLETPRELLLENGYSLVTAMKGRGLPDDSTAVPVALSKDGTRIYLDSENESITLARLPNGEFVSYDLRIPFYDTQRIPAITWSDGTANLADYDPTRRGGCGGGTFLNTMISDAFEGRLVIGGKTSNGENVYIFKNKGEKAYSDLYAAWAPYGDQQTKPTFETYLDSHPLFFWNDPFGRLILWTRGDSVSQAECGKPVVYLYPEKTGQVSVKLGSNIEVTKSEPTYANGWKVTAAPNGTLTTTEGKTFPYLYWDGNGASYETPTTGLVVASKNVEATLTEKLTVLGLNEKEIADFNEFWVPIVSKSPYARISFVPQDDWSKAAPLAISPAPQTVIRVFMDWQPLSAPITIEPQVLPPTPVRTGFTAVEWGGLLYKN